jgi:hypothetical protein
MWIPLGFLAYRGAVGRLLVPFLLVPALVGLMSVMGGLAERRFARGTFAGLWLALAALQLAAAGSVVASHEPYAFFFSGAEPYLAKRRSYAALGWLDRQLPRESKTLVLGLQELYASRRIVRGAGNSDGPRLARYLDAGDARTLAARLARDGFTHVAVYRPRIHESDAARVRGGEGERFLVLSTRQADVLRECLRLYASPLAEHDGFSLFRLGPVALAAESRNGSAGLDR